MTETTAHFVDRHGELQSVPWPFTVKPVNDDAPLIDDASWRQRVQEHKALTDGCLERLQQLLREINQDATRDKLKERERAGHIDEIAPPSNGEHVSPVRLPAV